MKKLLRRALLLSVFIVGTAAAHGQTPPDATVAAVPEKPITEAQLRTYLEESLLLQGIQQQIQNQLDENRKVSMPWIPAGLWRTIKEKAAAIDVPKVLFPVYQKYFTEEDGNAISLMFDGPTGHALAVASQVAGAAQVDKAAPVGDPRELTRKREAELTPEQAAAIRRMRANTTVKTLDGIKVDEDQNAALAKVLDTIMRSTLAGHQKELAAARNAYFAKQH